MNNKVIGLGLLVLSLGLVSCITTTRNAVFVRADAGVKARNYAQVAQTLDGPDSKTYYGDKDQVLRYLDSGLLYHLGGVPKESIKHLETAERLIDENYTKSISNAVASFLINDYQLEYFGEPYEDVYVNVFKAIDYMHLGKFDDAYVEIKRADEKLTLLGDKYAKLADSMNSSPNAKGAVKAGTTEFHNSALARYFSALLYRATGKLDDSAIDLREIHQAFETQPSIYDFPVPALPALSGEPGKIKLDVVAFAGRSPIKRASNLRINTAKNLILISQQKEDENGHLNFTSIAPIPFPGVDEGYNFKAELPEMVIQPSRVAKIRVVVDGVPVGELGLIEKLDSVALDTFKLTETPTFFKTVTRTVVKGVLTQKAKQAANQAASGAGTLGEVLSLAGGFAADLAVDASEQADLRSARFFPGQAYVGEFSVAPGKHVVTVEYYGHNGALLYRQLLPETAYTADGLNLISSYDLE
jgi:hypothetical protein